MGQIDKNKRWKRAIRSGRDRVKELRARSQEVVYEIVKRWHDGKFFEHM